MGRPITKRSALPRYTLFMSSVDSCALARYRCGRRLAMRRQFVLDNRTHELLEDLASYRAGNRSMVAREAIQL